MQGTINYIYDIRTRILTFNIIDDEDNIVKTINFKDYEIHDESYQDKFKEFMKELKTWRINQLISK